jgi:hypothetical protein
MTIQTTKVKPLSKTVRDAVRRNTSPGRHLAPAFAAFTHVFLFLLVCGGCAAGVALLWRAALDDPRFRLDGETLGLGGSVRRCPESVGELRAISLRFGGRSLLDPRLASDLENAYSGSVWVRHVSRMRRSFPNRMDVELQLRLPVAQVRNNHRYWMIDLEGVLLPVEGNAEPFDGLPEVAGVTANTLGGRPAPGCVWRDDGVAGALGVMRAFWGSPLSEVLPVARVVVNTGVFQGGGDAREIRRRFEVVTESGVVVRWGTYNDSPQTGDELTSAEKMWNLQELLSREEALRPGVCLDVRTRIPGYSLMQ